MARAILLGIDVGTTLLKAAAVDDRTGRPLASASAKLPVRSAAGGTREQDPAALDRALRRLARRLRLGLGRRWTQLAGVGLAAQGGSAILVDRHTGRAHTPMQLWNDTRPLGLLPAIAARKGQGYWRGLSYQPGPGAGLARIAWLRRRRPDLFGEDHIYAGAGEYTYFHLTGLWRQDAGNALQIGCYDARRHRLAPGPLRLVGVERSFVAPLRQGHETHPLHESGAKLLALPTGLPVAGPYIDHEAAYQGAAAAADRPLLCSLGTAWVGSYVRPHGPPPDGALDLVLPSPAGPGDLVLRVMRAGTGTWDWALAKLLGGVTARARARAEAMFEERLLPHDGLVVLPWLARPNLVDPVCAGGGGFVGIGRQTARADLLRAVAAGLCFEFAHTLEPVLAEASVDRVVLCGGAAAGRFFRELLAALLAPLRVLWLEDHATVAARGAIQSLRTSPPRLRGRSVRRPPRQVRGTVRAQYRQYCELCRALADGLGRQCPDVLRSYRGGNHR